MNIYYSATCSQNILSIFEIIQYETWFWGGPDKSQIVDNALNIRYVKTRLKTVIKTSDYKLYTSNVFALLTMHSLSIGSDLPMTASILNMQTSNMSY